MFVVKTYLSFSLLVLQPMTTLWKSWLWQMLCVVQVLVVLLLLSLILVMLAKTVAHVLHVCRSQRKLLQTCLPLLVLTVS
ncbi:Uncharacterised protein [Acinetobacter baumannii]|nr:Uncharacterised protein [Acinetobacter baumannii]